MKKLEKLGVTVEYKSENDRLAYSISVDHSKFSNPRKKDKYFCSVVEVISADANRKGGLENLTVSADPIDILKLKEATKSKLAKARGERKIIDNFNNDEGLVFSSALKYGGIVFGGIAGVVLTYPPMAEIGLDAAEYVNNILPTGFNSLLPRLTQAGISIGSTALGTVVGVVGGGIVGKLSSAMLYYIPITPDFRKVKIYEALDKVLSVEEVKSDVDSPKVSV